MPCPNIVTPEPFNANNLRKKFSKSALGLCLVKHGCKCKRSACDSLVDAPAIRDSGIF